MLSGRQALAQIATAERGEQTAVIELDAKLEELGQQLLALQRQRAEDLRALARLRLDLIDVHPLTGALDVAEQRVSERLREREQALATLAQALTAARAAHAAQAPARDAAAERLEQAAARLDEAEGMLQEQLGADPEYQALQARAEAAERQARHAAEKADASAAEQADKGGPYRADVLFMYLWERDHGGPADRAWGPIRWLDGKVAKLIGFADAAANYRRLLELPERLAEHAEVLAEQAEQAFEALRTRDEAARAATDIPALVAARDQEQAALDAVDEEMSAHAEQIQRLLAEEANFAAGEDEYSRQAIADLAAALANTDLEALRRAALATPFPDDDEIVARLQRADQEQRKLSFAIDGLRQTRLRHQERLGELAGLQQDFRRRRLDQSDVGFADGAMIALSLANFLNGMLNRRDLMRVLEQQQYRQPRRADPGFGSGAFGRGSPWGRSGGSTSRSSGRSSSSPSSRRSSGGRTGGSSRSGGFRTGGGSRGGGFRTGGGF